MNRFWCSSNGSLQNYSIIALSFLRNHCKKHYSTARFPSPSSSTARARPREATGQPLYRSASTKICMLTTKISRLKRRSGGSMAYVVTFGRAMATGLRRPEKRRREGNECSYCLGLPSGLNKCATSRVPAGAQIVTYMSA